MLHTVPFLGTLSRVPRGEVTSEIARDPPHSLDILTSADWATVVDHSLIVAAPTGVNWIDVYKRQDGAKAPLGARDVASNGCEGNHHQ